MEGQGCVDTHHSFYVTYNCLTQKYSHHSKWKYEPLYADLLVQEYCTYKYDNWHGVERALCISLRVALRRHPVFSDFSGVLHLI